MVKGRKSQEVKSFSSFEWKPFGTEGQGRPDCDYEVIT